MGRLVGSVGWLVGWLVGWVDGSVGWVGSSGRSSGRAWRGICMRGKRARRTLPRIYAGNSAACGTALHSNCGANIKTSLQPSRLQNRVSADTKARVNGGLSFSHSVQSKAILLP